MKDEDTLEKQLALMSDDEKAHFKMVDTGVG
jgi:hypothetical protein